MIFTETKLQGAFILELDKREDDRGFFARSWCQKEFQAHHLNPRIVQCNISFNRVKGTLRGMHYQAAPHGEVKIVGCTAGAILDVVVDLRAGSPTRLAWCAVELTPASGAQLYIPAGFAHGFLTLADDTEVTYRMGARYVPDAARGVRWDDPRLGIAWPARPAVISERDATYPDLDPERLDA